MATSTISNTVTGPTGAVVSGALVEVRLMPSGGFRISDFTEVARLVTTTTNGSGFWSLALERNSNITPSNSWYEVTEHVPNSQGGKRVWQIAVGASDQTLLASLVTPAQQQPTVVPAGTVYLDQASADARYQALAAIGATPNTIEPDDAASAGVSSSAARADHEHGIVAAAAVATGDANSEGAATSFSRSDHVHKGVVANEAWTAYTPTWSGTLGNGTLTGRYARLGRTIHFVITLTWGTTTSHPASNQQFSLPATAQLSGYYAPIGQTVSEDTGVALNAGVALQVSTTTIEMLNQNGTPVTQAAPMAWGNTDKIAIRGTYEAEA